MPKKFDKDMVKDKDAEVEEALDPVYDDEEKLNDKEFAKLKKKGTKVEEEEEYDSSDDEDNDDDDDDVKETKKKSMKESLTRVFEGEELSESFQEKATTLFETVLGERTQQIREELEAEYEAKIQEATEQLEESLNKYLDYAVDIWMEENRLAVENGLKAEIFEDFMGDLKTVFERHYVEMPEGATDLVENLTSQVAEKEDQLEEAIERGMALVESVKSIKAEKVLAEASKDLTMTQAEKLKSLVEGAEIEFKNEDDYAAKIDTIRKSYFTENSQNLSNGSDEQEIIEEDVSDEDSDTKELNESSSDIVRFAQFASRAGKLKTRKI